MDHVLLIATRPGALDTLAFFLMSHGFTVEVADGVARASYLAAAHRPSLVLAERALGASLGALPARIPRVAIGAPSPELASQFDDYLPAGAQGQQVLRTLRRCLRSVRRAAASLLLPLTAPAPAPVREDYA